MPHLAWDECAQPLFELARQPLRQLEPFLEISDCGFPTTLTSRMTRPISWVRSAKSILIGLNSGQGNRQFVMAVTEALGRIRYG